VVVSPRSDRALSEFGVIQGPRQVRLPKEKANAREGERDRRGFVTEITSGLKTMAREREGGRLFYDCMAQVSSLC
jgi:hypothetical protein